ncbi:MAG: hypothetical protein GWN64_17090 [Candidatus Thorarchaeota archaeon]|nr:hypothetical protein [Candidatus Thorarchaeota archaeon]
MRCVKCHKKMAKAKDRKDWKQLGFIPTKKPVAVCPKHITVVPIFKV